MGAGVVAETPVGEDVAAVDVAATVVLKGTVDVEVTVGIVVVEKVRIVAVGEVEEETVAAAMPLSSHLRTQGHRVILASTPPLVLS